MREGATIRFSYAMHAMHAMYATHLERIELLQRLLLRSGPLVKKVLSTAARDNHCQRVDAGHSPRIWRPIVPPPGAPRDRRLIGALLIEEEASKIQRL